MKTDVEVTMLSSVHPLLSVWRFDVHRSLC
jgi:hypothetical protein